MDNILMHYFNERFGSGHSGDQASPGKGPVITISRQAGCPAGLFAERLREGILEKAKRGGPGDMRIISKEILSEAARELGMSEKKIAEIVEVSTRTTIEEIIEALSSRYYKSDLRIRNTISGVIRSIAASGSVIIIGRGAAALLQERTHTLHIRLEAPEAWRVDRLMRKYKWQEEEAVDKMRQWDEGRMKLIRSFSSRRDIPSLYDVTYNCSRVSLDKMVSASLALL
jgi:cytidylate kinase